MYFPSQHSLMKASDVGGSSVTPRSSRPRYKKTHFTTWWKEAHGIFQQMFLVLVAIIEYVVAARSILPSAIKIQGPRWRQHVFITVFTARLL